MVVLCGVYIVLRYNKSVSCRGNTLGFVVAPVICAAAIGNCIIKTLLFRHHNTCSKSSARSYLLLCF